MRRVIAVIALMALALPAAAEEPQTLEIGYNSDGYTRAVISWSHDKHAVHWGVVGPYLWLEWGDPNREADSHSGDHVSIDISDPSIVTVVAHVDGTVDIIRETPEPPVESPTKPEPLPVETVDMVEEFPQMDWPRLFGVYPE